MKVIDLEPRHERMFARCLEDRDAEAVDSGELRQCWIDKMKPRGLRAKIAVDDSETPIGMIQYVPTSETLVERNSDGYYIYCVWVPKYNDDRGDHQGQGIGSALLEAAETDARELGASGMAAWGLAIPVWMRASWFKKHGYRKVDRSGIAALMWKPFTPGASQPLFVRPRKRPTPIPGQVTVTSLIQGHCRAANVAHLRAMRAAEDAGAPVSFTAIDTTDLAVAREWGMLDGLFVDDRQVSTGPPPTYEKLARIIKARVNRL